MTSRLTSLSLCLAVLSAPVAAQTIEGAITIPSEFDVHDRGWSQLYNLEEILEFFLALVETTAMTAVLAFHPRSVARRARRLSVFSRRRRPDHAQVSGAAEDDVSLRAYWPGGRVFGHSSRRSDRFRRFRYRQLVSI